MEKKIPCLDRPGAPGASLTSSCVLGRHSGSKGGDFIVTGSTIHRSIDRRDPETDVREQVTSWCAGKCCVPPHRLESLLSSNSGDFLPHIAIGGNFVFVVRVTCSCTCALIRA